MSGSESAASDRESVMSDRESAAVGSLTGSAPTRSLHLGSVHFGSAVHARLPFPYPYSAPAGIHAATYLRGMQPVGRPVMVRMMSWCQAAKC